MAYFSTAPAPGHRNLTAKNRVLDFFPLSNKTHPANRRQPAQPRRKIRPTPTKTVSGIPYWPARDPIGETGGENLYGFVGNDGVDRWDVLGAMPIHDDNLPGALPSPSPGSPRNQIAETCRKKRRKLQRDLVAARDASLPRKPSCGNGSTFDKWMNSGCGLVTLVIALPDPCEDVFTDQGHAGVAVADNFYDFGPLGDHWSKNEKTLVGLIDSRKAIPIDSKRDIMSISFCACNASSVEASMLELRSNFQDFTYSLYNLHCTSAVQRALFGLSARVPAVGTGETPTRLFWNYASATNRCGGDKGERSHVEVVSLRNIEVGLPSISKKDL
jgi:hypothetical protein